MSIRDHDEELSASLRQSHYEGPIETEHEARAGFISSLRYLDLVLVLAVVALSVLGLWSLFGAVRGSAFLSAAADRQVTWLGISLCAMAVTLVLDYRWLGRIAPLMYAGNLLLLIAVLFLGEEINNSKSWFRVGGVSFQPSETMKIVTALMMAQWFSLRPEGVRRVRDFVEPLVLCAVPALLILKQGDLGTASLFGLLFIVVVFWAGTRTRLFVGIIALGIVGSLCAYPVLNGYQKERIRVFLDPDRDPGGKGYNAIQSKVAVGSGGLLGQGWGQGSQAVHRYLPEAHTDFIFASTVEQAGFAGALVLLALYAVVFWRVLHAVEMARDRFGGLTVVGLGAILFGHVFINICMNIGLFPITGLPLPFVSYGGSFLLAMYVLVGMVLSVSMRRFVFNR